MISSREGCQDTGLACLVMLARFHGVAADAGQLQHQFGRSGEVFGVTELLRGAEFLGLKARQIISDCSRLDRIPFPAIARHRDGHYLILGGLKSEGNDPQVLVQEPRDPRPRILPGAISTPCGAAR